MNTIQTVTMHCLINLEKCTDAAQAAALCGVIYRTAKVQYESADIIRALEQRMPAPSRAQAEYVSLVGCTHGLHFARALGAYGESVVYVLPRATYSYTDGAEDTFSFLQCKEDITIRHPSWDPFSRKRPVGGAA